MSKQVTSNQATCKKGGLVIIIQSRTLTHETWNMFWSYTPWAVFWSLSGYKELKLTTKLFIGRALYTLWLSGSDVKINISFQSVGIRTQKAKFYRDYYRDVCVK